jgi:serine/threonine-protein kinase
MEMNLIGQTLGAYRITGQIGLGGMAIVYKAYDPALDRNVAIKVLPQYFAHDPDFSTRFEREARAVARLDHPNILPIYGFGQEHGLSYIVMRYVETGTLKDLLSAPVDLTTTAHILSQVGYALDYAHQRGIIHRDVKPGNVLLAEGNWALLSDFGLARMVEGSVQITKSGVGVGTPAYMSPEQGQGLKVDARSDIYSLGVVLYEMTTSRVPYEAETPMAVVLQHITAPLPLPRHVNPSVPEAVERVILKAMAKDPESRYQTAAEMTRAMVNATEAPATQWFLDAEPRPVRAAPLRQAREPAPPPPEVEPADVLPPTPIPEPVPGTPTAETIAPPAPTPPEAKPADVPPPTPIPEPVPDIPTAETIAPPTTPPAEAVPGPAGETGETRPLARKRLPAWAWGLIGVLVVLVIAGGIFAATQGGAPARTSQAAAQLATTPSRTPQATATRTAAPTSAVPAKATATRVPPTRTPTSTKRATSTSRPTSTPSPTRKSSVTVEVKAVERTWLQVTVDGEREAGQNLEAGERQQWEGRSMVHLLCGNAGGVEVTVNGRALGKLGDPGEVVIKIWTPRGEVTPTPTPKPTRPAGRWVGQCDEQVPPQLCTTDNRTGKVTQVTDDLQFSVIDESTWSPDGRQIVFAAGSDSEATGRYDHKLYIINLDGTGLRQITSGDTNDVSPAWSPDGQWIAFHRWGGLWIVRPDGSDARVLLEESDRFLAQAIVWSPDSQRIALLNARAEGAPNVWVVNRDGSDARVVYTASSDWLTVAWSPNGLEVACWHWNESAERHEGVLVSADGSGEPETLDEVPYWWRPSFWPQWASQ